MVVRPICIISPEEFREAWDWFLDHISIDQVSVEEYGYLLDHKHWEYPDCIKCIDKCDNADIYLARLYLISQLSSVSDYLPDLKAHAITFSLEYYSDQLDADVARVVRAQETTNHLNAFRNSLSEHLGFWAILASIIKIQRFHDFSILKPNLQPEDKGPDGLACVVFGNLLLIKIISIKNSIKSPQELISSASFRNNSGIDLQGNKILDEFYATQNRIKGFQRLDDKLSILLQELHMDIQKIGRENLFNNQSQFNASIIADEQYANIDLFAGFNKISDRPIQRIGIYIGSEDWKKLAIDVQKKLHEIFESKGISF